MLVANKANSEMLDFVLAAEVWQGLSKDHDCWAKELLAGLTFVDPSKDWKTHMQQLLPFIYLFIVTSAQLRSRCDVWLAVKASLQTVHHVLHAASESGS